MKNNRPFSVDHRKQVEMFSNDPRVKNLEKYRSRLGRSLEVYKEIPEKKLSLFKLGLDAYGYFIFDNLGDYQSPYPRYHFINFGEYEAGVSVNPPSPPPPDNPKIPYFGEKVLLIDNKLWTYGKSPSYSQPNNGGYVVENLIEFANTKNFGNWPEKEILLNSPYYKWDLIDIFNNIEDPVKFIDNSFYTLFDFITFPTYKADLILNKENKVILAPKLYQDSIWHTSTLSGGGWVTAAWHPEYGIDGDEQFVIFSQNSSSIKTSVDGVTWTARTLPISANWSSCIVTDPLFGTGVFLAVANNSSQSLYSANGRTWTVRSMPSTQDWSSIAASYSTQGFYRTVAVSKGSNIAAYASSTFLPTWISTNMPVSAQWSSVTSFYSSSPAFSGFVAVAGGPSDIAAVSSDGITWTQVTLPVSADWSSVCFDKYKKKIVAVAKGSSDVAVSSDGGVTWELGELPVVADWVSVTASNQTASLPTDYIAISSGNPAYVATSSDGITWTLSPNVSNGSWKQIIQASIGTPGANDGSVSSFLAISSDASNNILKNNGGSQGVIAVSNDNINWSMVKLPRYFNTEQYEPNNSKPLWTIAKVLNDKFFLFGASAYNGSIAENTNLPLIAYSDDGENWNFAENIGLFEIPSFVSESYLIESVVFQSCTYGNSKYVAFVEAGPTALTKQINKSLYSSDGNTWSIANLPISKRWSNVAYGNGLFIASGREVDYVSSKTFSSATFNGTEVTITTDSDHELNIGDSITVIGINPKVFEGLYTVKDIISTNQFTYDFVSTENLLYGAGTVYKMGEGQEIITSEDGVTWTNIAIPELNSYAITALEFINNNFVAVCMSFPSSLFYTSPGIENFADPGTAWRINSDQTVESIPYSPRGTIGTLYTITSPTDTYMTEFYDCYEGTDDPRWEFTLPFNINYNGTSYNKIYVSGNSYVTFGQGSCEWIATALSPNSDKILVDSYDRSSNKCYFYTNGTEFSIRIHCGSTYSNPESEAIIWELYGSSSNPNSLELTVISNVGDGLSGAYTSSAIFSSIGGGPVAINHPGKIALAYSGDGINWTVDELPDGQSVEPYSLTRIMYIPQQ